jgi:ABC-type amino acid transport substrate-binding protein
MPSTFKTIFIAVLASLATWFVLPQQSAVSIKAKETAFERVVRTGVLRCGYGISPPILVKNSNTGKLQGSDVEIMNAIGKKLGLKVEWAQEAGWGSFIEDLRSNRYDVMCTGVWPDAARIKFLALTRPVYYDRMLAYVREGDMRFEGDLTKANSATVTIAAVEGDASIDLVRQHFPQAKILALPQMAQVGDMLMSLTTKKADIIFLDPVRSAEFQKNNPQRIRQVLGVEPVQVFGVSIGVNAGETQLRDMLDTALRELINNGTVARELAKISSNLIPPAKGLEFNQ